MVEQSRKVRQAIALSYENGEEAPRIAAAGRGYVADKIIETAAENQVPLYEDAQLVQTLSKLEIGDGIPPELYGVVAEILVFVQDIDQLKSKIGI